MSVMEKSMRSFGVCCSYIVLVDFCCSALLLPLLSRCSVWSPLVGSLLFFYLYNFHRISLIFCVRPSVNWTAFSLFWKNRLSLRLPPYISSSTILGFETLRFFHAVIALIPWRYHCSANAGSCRGWCGEESSWSSSEPIPQMIMIEQR